MIFNVLDHGAIGDGRTRDTAALQAAIDTAQAAGGSVVLVPPGRYLTGTLFLRDRITLELQPGATLLGSADLSEYRASRGKGAGADNDQHPHCLIVAKGLQRVSIQGGGVVDGQGRAFRRAAVSSEARGAANERGPISLIEIVDCQDVTVAGITLTRSAGWTLRLIESDRVVVRGVTIQNDPHSPNSDGVGITGCRDVTVCDCRVDTRNDAIVLKSHGRTVERVTITNCVLRSLGAGIKIGTGACRTDIRQILVANSIVTGSHRGVHLSAAGGSVLEDILLNSVIYDSCVPVVLPSPIHLDVSGPPDDPIHGSIRQVTISNVIARTNGRIVLTAAKGGHIENVVLRDIQLAYPHIEDPRLYASGTQDTSSSIQSPAARNACAAVVAENIRNLSLENLSIRWPDETVPDAWRIPIKNEHGGVRVFNPDYTNPRPVAFGVLWGQGLLGGHLRAPAAASSTEAAPRVQLTRSSFRVIE